MNPVEDMNREAQRLALLAELSATEAALRSNLDLNCAEATARAHMQRALAHIQEAQVALSVSHRARTVWQLVKSLTKCRRELNEFRSGPAAQSAIRQQH